MEKIIKKWGTSLVIVLDKEDIKINKLQEGDIIDIELCKIKREIDK